jgi:DnaJ-domain-containing protein 1
MFLNSLNPTEKDNFMKLAMTLIKADGVVEESEKQILSAYANEMQIQVRSLDEQCDTDKVIEELAKSSSLKTRRIIFLELLALAFADGNYVAEEKELLKCLANAFELDRTFIDRAVNLEDAYVAAYMSLVNLVEKGE